MFNIDDDLKLVILDYHNYHQCVSLDHTLITTWNYFHSVIPQLTLESLKSIINSQDIIRKNAVNQVNYHLLIEYLVKLYNPGCDLDKVLNLIEHFQQVLQDDLPEFDPASILAFVDILYVHYHCDTCLNLEEQLSKLYGKFEQYTSNNTFYVSGLNLPISDDIASISVIGNLTGTEFLDPYVVSSSYSNSFNYFPTGMFNPYQFYIYLLRMNFEFQLQQRKVLIICPNNCRLVKLEFTNIEIFYVDMMFDKFYTQEYLRFPDEFGVKDWIYQKLTKSVVGAASIAIPSLLYQYNNIRDQLLHDPVINQFHQLNIQLSGFLPGSSFNCQPTVERIIFNNDKFTLDNEAPSEAPILDYHYRIENVYYIIGKLAKFKTLPDQPSTTNLDSIVPFFTQKLFPMLISDKCGLYHPFALLFNELLQSYDYSNEHVSSLFPQFNHSFCTEEQMRLYTAGINIDRELRGDDTGITRPALTSVFSNPQLITNQEAPAPQLALPFNTIPQSSAPELPPPTTQKSQESELPPVPSPTKRKCSMTDENGIVKKSKILERLQRDKLNFVSIFDDEDEDVEDSFDSKIQRFKYTPNSNGATRDNSTTQTSQLRVESNIVNQIQSTPEPLDLPPNKNILPEQSIEKAVSSSDEDDSDSYESSSEEEANHSEYVESDVDVPVTVTKLRSTRDSVTPPVTIHPSQFYKTSAPAQQVNFSKSIEMDDVSGEEDSDDSDSVVYRPVSMSSPVSIENEEYSEDEENAEEQEDVGKEQADIIPHDGESRENKEDAESEEDNGDEEDEDEEDEKVEQEQEEAAQVEDERNELEPMDMEEVISEKENTEEDNMEKDNIEQIQAKEDEIEKSNIEDIIMEEEIEVEQIEEHAETKKEIHMQAKVFNRNLSEEEESSGESSEEDSDEESSEESDEESGEEQSKEVQKEDRPQQQLPLDIKHANEEQVMDQPIQIDQKQEESEDESSGSSSHESSDDDESSSTESIAEEVIETATATTNANDKSDDMEVDENVSNSSSSESSSEEESSSEQLSSEESSSDSEKEVEEVKEKEQPQLIQVKTVAETLKTQSPVPIRRMMPSLSNVKLPSTTIESKSSPVRQQSSPTKSKFKLSNDSDSESESESESETNSDSDSDSSSERHTENETKPKNIEDKSSTSSESSDNDSERSDRDSNSENDMPGHMEPAVKLNEQIKVSASQPTKVVKNNQAEGGGGSKRNISPIIDTSDSSDDSDTDSDGSIGF